MWRLSEEPWKLQTNLGDIIKNFMDLEKFLQWSWKTIEVRVK